MVLNQWRILKMRLLRLLLAASLAVPFGVGINQALPAHASVCYYGAWTYDTVSEVPTPGATFSSTVRYQIGYSCAGYADSVYIDWWQDKITFTGQGSSQWHWTTQAAACEWFDPSTWYCAKEWGIDYTQYKCVGNCTLARTEYPRRWFNYDSRQTVYSHWAAINYLGLNYSTYHRFLKHQLYHDFCC